MSGVFLILFVVFCPLILSESGDFDVLNVEDVICSSRLSFNQSNLTCFLIDTRIEEANLTLCYWNGERQFKCTNAIPGQQEFTFSNLSPMAKYELHIETEEYVKKNIDLRKIVKMSAPQIKLATYIEDAEESYISIQHVHDYVQTPQFQVEIFGQNTKTNMSFFTEQKNLTISRDKLGGDGVYNIHARAKPAGYFDGMWSEWSAKVTFTIKTPDKVRNIDPSIVTYIIIIFCIFLVLITILGSLRWRTHIKDYMKPNIPHPKTTLAQIQRGKEGFPFIFSPEIFRDTFINQVDYDEKPSAEELQEGQDECYYSQASSADSRSTSVCEMDANVAELLPKEQSHLKIGLLGESGFPAETEAGSEGRTVLQQQRKEEAYVTMSSLFKTQSRLD